MASKYSCLAQTPCAKTREFGFAEFSDCLPVFALVCVFAFDTGGLGLWLGAFGRSRLYRCQSVPGPPMPCFVAQSFGGQRLSSRPSRRRVEGSCIGFWKSKANSTFCKVVLLHLVTPVLSAAVCKSSRIRHSPNSWDSYAGFLWHRASLLRLVTPVLSAAVCKSSRIRHSPNSGTVRRFPVLPTPSAKTAKSCAFCGSLPVFALERFFVVQEWGWRTSRGVFCVVFMWFLRGCGAGLGARGSRVFCLFCQFFMLPLQ